MFFIHVESDKRASESRRTSFRVSNANPVGLAPIICVLKMLQTEDGVWLSP